MNTKEKIEKNGVLIIISFVTLVIIISIGMSIYSKNSEPVIRVDVSLIENNNGQIEIKDIDLKQESTVNPNISEHNFPSIIGAVTLKNASLGFGSTKYNGAGRYTFNVGFGGYHPTKNDEMRLSILIINKTGDRLGYFERDLIWR